MTRNEREDRVRKMREYINQNRRRKAKGDEGEDRSDWGAQERKGEERLLAFRKIYLNDTRLPPV